MSLYNFGPASSNETIVHGSGKPGYRADEVEQWIAFMKGGGIRRVVCLLTVDGLRSYEADLLQAYRSAFGGENVLHAPVENFSLCDRSTLTSILSFLKESDRDGMKTVVHCYAGSGRTGHVLAAWLVYGRNFDVEDALDAVQCVDEVYRNPFEAVDDRQTSRADLIRLLESV